MQLRPLNALLVAAIAASVLPIAAIAQTGDLVDIDAALAEERAAQAPADESMAAPPEPMPSLAAPQRARTAPAVPAAQPLAAPAELPAARNEKPLAAADPESAGPAVLTVKTEGPDEWEIGRPQRLTFTVKNSGEGEAESVILALNAGADIALHASRPQGKIDSRGMLRFDLGKLAAGAVRRIEVDASIQKRGDFELNAFVGCFSNKKIRMQTRQARLDVDLHFPKQAIHGQPVWGELIVVNTGSLPAEGVKIFADFPEHAAVLAGESPFLSLGDIGIGETRRTRITLLPKKLGPIAGNLSIEGKHTRVRESVELQVKAPSVGLSVSGPEVLGLKDSGIYALLVSNEGPAMAEDIQVVAKIPAGLKVNKVSQSAKWDAERRTLTFTLPRIAAADSVSLRLEAVAETEGAHKLLAATLFQGEVLRHHEVATRVICRPDVKLFVQSSGVPAEVDSPVDVTLMVINQGDKVADEVVVRALLPESVAAVASSAYEVDGRTVTLRSLTLQPGEKQSLRIRLIGMAAGDQVIRFETGADYLSRPLIAEQGLFFYESRPKRYAERP